MSIYPLYTLFVIVIMYITSILQTPQDNTINLPLNSYVAFKVTTRKIIFYIDHFQCSSFIPKDPTFPWESFPLAQRTLVFLVVCSGDDNSLSFYLYENVYFTFTLKGYFYCI